MDAATASSEPFDDGYPAVAPGSTVEFGSRELFRVKALSDPSDDPRSRSFPAGSEDLAVCNVSTPAENGPALKISFAFRTDTLPHLQIWHDFRPHACVLSIEPCTSARLDTPGPEAVLTPGNARRYELCVSFSPDRELAK
jgi:hypothetical protein